MIFLKLEDNSVAGTFKSELESAWKSFIDRFDVVIQISR
jgi:hypothetical protein